MEVIVITHTQLLSDEAAIVNHLFEAGLPCLHLRKPGATEAEIRQWIEGIAPQYHSRICLHTFHHLAPDYGIHRLHYAEQQRLQHMEETQLRYAEQHQPYYHVQDNQALNIPEWQQQQNNGYLLSTSIHHLNSLPALQGSFAYTFFGPVFNSISKQGYERIVADDFYLPDSSKTIPVIALGGITDQHLAQVKAMNFDGVALLGYLWEQPERAPALFTRLMENCKHY